MIPPIREPVTSLVLVHAVWRDLHRAVGQSLGSQREVCRLLTGSVEGGRALAAESIEYRNRSASGSQFSLPVSDIQDAHARGRRRGLRLLAVLHTHPSGLARPSLWDLELPRTTGLLSMIAAMENDTIRIACYGFYRRRTRSVAVEFLSVEACSAA
jgi:proteasome lid subunit RPN8/RPN11